VTAPGAAGRGLLAFAALSGSYFAHIGFFNPYLPLWLKAQGLPIFTISLLAAVQSLTRVFAPHAWGALSDHTGERVRLLRISAAIALMVSFPPVVPWRRLVDRAGPPAAVTHASSMMGLTEGALASWNTGMFSPVFSLNQPTESTRCFACHP